ncbi:hemagglutinin [Variovorax dokdonensis]
MAALLTACGGGGGGGGTGGSVGGADAAGPSTASQGVTTLSAACSACGAVDDRTYAGAGTGVWQVSNTSGAAADFPVAIDGLQGQSVTLVFTNETESAVAMPSLQVLADTTSVLPSATLLAKTSLPQATNTASGVLHDQMDARDRSAIDAFNRSGFEQHLNTAPAPARHTQLSALKAVVTYGVGQQRTVYLSDQSQRTVQLARQRLAGDGTTINVWVETSELRADRVSDALVSRIDNAFGGAGGVYDMLLKVGGPLWGPHSQASLIDGSGQPIDLFFVNFDHNAQPYGLGGYFWALNNFRKGSSGLLAQSNESIGMFMDTETMYLDGEQGLKQVVTALAHEGTHMQNFYRRGVLLGAQYTFDTWLEEMTAMMMEDWASYALDPSHNAIRDVRFPYYLSWRNTGSYNCSLIDWTPMGADCESYAVNGSFGGYLNRQFGLGFYESLLRNTGETDSVAMLDKAIRAQRADSGLGKELRQFASASAGLVPLSSGVAPYSMPARSDDGLHLVAVDPHAIGESMRRLPQSVPAELKGLASLPVSRSRRVGTYAETVRVPPGTTLTVVVN